MQGSNSLVYFNVLFLVKKKKHTSQINMPFHTIKLFLDECTNNVDTSTETSSPSLLLLENCRIYTTNYLLFAKTG